MKRSLLSACAGLALAVGLAACDSQTTEQKVDSFLESAATKLDAGERRAAIIELKNALQLKPENVQARKRLGEVYLTVGKGKSAAKEFQKAREHGAQSPRLMVNLARAHVMAGEPDKVLDLVEPATSDTVFADANRRTLYGLRARALWDTGESEKARALARRILNDGESAPARVVMATALAGANDFEAALAHAEAALDTRPKDPELLWLKARILISDDRRAAAEPVLETARKQPWRPILVDMALAELALQQGDTERAWSVVAGLEKQFGDDPRVQYFAALRALVQDNNEEAREIAEGLAGQYSNFARAAYIAGVANLRLENHELARSYLERYLNRFPQNDRARVMLAQAWRGLGDDKQARAVLDDAESLGSQARRRQLAAADVTGDLGALDGESIDTPEGRRQQVREIIGHMQRKEFDAAMTKAKELAEAVPDSPAPGQIQAAVSWNRGNRDAAVAQLEALVETFPDNAGVKLNLARMHRALGQTDQALSVLTPAMAAHPKNPGLKVEAARNHAQKNNGEKVRGLLQAALDADPKAVDARAYLARFHLLQGRPDKAVEIAQAAPDEQATSNAALLEVIGRASQAQGAFERALDAFENLTEAAPKAAVGYLRAGETLLAMNRPADAVGYLEKARERAESPKQAEIYLARALLQSGKGERAGQLLSELEKTYPEESDVAMLRGNHALSYAEDAEAAVAAFAKALELDPTEPRLFDLVRVHARSGQRDAAIERLQAWRESHEASAAVLSALAELHLASDHYANAAKLYRELADRDPDNAAYRNNLAWTLAQQGNLEPALAHAEKAVELAPENAGVLDTLGLIHLRQGNAAEARKHLAKAAKAAPNAAEIQLNYAEALIASGDRETATGVLGQLSERSLSKDESARVQRLRAKLE